MFCRFFGRFLSSSLELLLPLLSLPLLLPLLLLPLPDDDDDDELAERPRLRAMVTAALRRRPRSQPLSLWRFAGAGGERPHCPLLLP